MEQLSRKSGGGFRWYVMVDILFPVFNRSEFATAAIEALERNTDWQRARLLVHEDLRGVGPVAIMNDYLSRPGSDVFVKIDSDTIVPPGWFEAGLAVMEAHPELGLLGIEPPASRTAAPWSRERVPAPELAMPGGRGYAPCESIGGIGFMRRSAFFGRETMRPHGFHGVGGFTDWQRRHPEIIKGWILPPRKVFLLDRLPVEPWASLSKGYIQKGWQRPWTNYSPADSELWDWWVNRVA